MAYYNNSAFFDQDYKGPGRSLSLDGEAEEKTAFGGEGKESYKSFKNDPAKPLNEAGKSYCGPGRYLGGKY